MAAQDELFQLIKSLTPSEKRYFKVNGDSKSNYMQLFDAMDKQKEEYDEDLLKKKNAKKPFIKYLSAEKKQLREQIMKHMRAYRADSTIDNKINELLQDEAFYRDKGLKPLREKAIAKAKELATKYERFHLLNDIIYREIALVEEFESKSLSHPINELINEWSDSIQKQELFITLWSKNKEIFSAYRSGLDPKNPEIQEQASKLIIEVGKHADGISNQFRLEQALYRAYSNYHNLLREREKSYQFTLKEYQLYQTFPHFKEQESLNYKICLSNLISRAQTANRIEEFLKYIDELKSLPIISFNEEGEVFQNIYFLEHLHYINSGQFDKAEELVPVIEEGLDRYSDKINKARFLSFNYNIMVMYFIMHRFKDALDWANKILDDKSEIKQDISNTTKVLLPIIHFELGHHDLVDNLTRSAYRTLSNKNRLHDFEKVLIKYLKGMPLSSDSDEFKSKLDEFSLELKQVQQKQTMKSYAMEEVSLWVDSHQSNRKMSVLLSHSVS